MRKSQSKHFCAVMTIMWHAAVPRYLQETVATRRDKGDNTLCAECGNPNNLKLCSGKSCLLCHFA